MARMLYGVRTLAQACQATFRSPSPEAAEFIKGVLGAGFRQPALLTAAQAREEGADFTHYFLFCEDYGPVSYHALARTFTASAHARYLAYIGPLGAGDLVTVMGLRGFGPLKLACPVFQVRSCPTGLTHTAHIFQKVSRRRS